MKCSPRQTFDILNTVTVVTAYCVSLSLVASALTSSIAGAAIPPYDSAPSDKSKPIDVSLKTTDDFSKGFNIATIRPMDSTRDVKAADIQKVIPQDMQPSSSGGQVAAKILDRSVNSYFNSDAMRRTDIGRTATTVEKSMATDVSFGGQQPESIHHSVKFAIQPAQTQAKLSYTGVTNADLTYKATSSTANFEVREPVSILSTNLVFNHINSPSDRKDILSLRWVW
jgi:hypothetical protein